MTILRNADDGHVNVGQKCLPFFLRPGNGESCVACSEIIAETQFAMEGIGAQRTVRQFHVGCFSLWNIERTAVTGIESGVQANRS